MFLASLVLLFFSSCFWDFDKGTPHPPIPMGQLAMIQASPESPPINLSLNFNGPINYLYSHNQPLQFGDFLTYKPVDTLTRVANVDSASTSGVIYSGTIGVSQNKYYSLFIVDTIPHVQILYLKDTLKRPASGQAGIRFINLSPNAAAVDLLVENTGTNVTNKSFMAYSGFVPVNSGVYTLHVNQTGTANELATLPNVTLNSDGLYTVWLQGLSGGTNSMDKLTINMMNNVQY